MQDYRPNSNRFKEQQKQQQQESGEKKVQKVVSGKVRTKTNNTRKLTSIFISEDVSNVRSYIFMDVLVPAIKKALSDIVRDGVDMLLYGEPHGSKDRSSRVPYVSYNKASTSRRDDRRVNHVRSGYNFEDIVLETRGDAEELLCQLDEAIEKYGVISVADLYDSVDLPHNFTDNKYGWTSLRTAEVVRARGGGYILKLPRAMPID